MAALEALKAKVEAGAITPEEAVKEAEAIRPGLGKAFMKWAGFNVVALASLGYAMTHDAQSSAADQRHEIQIVRMAKAQEGQADALRALVNMRQQSAEQNAQGENRKARRARQAQLNRTKKR